MSVDLTSSQAVRTSLFVRIDVAEYKATSGASFANEVLTFSDHNATFTIDAESYVPIGSLLNITSSSSELRSSSNTITITLSGIPDSSIAEIIYSKIKGSPVKIYRAYFHARTGIQIGTTQGRYIGTVNNYSLDEEYDVGARTASNSLQIECLSNVDILSSKIAGRKTNPQSMKQYYSTDVSFDRVPNLKDASFNFGAPQ
tara:strand:+ start:9550 stop:10149 length:600 start_codon:yes stop_codon:yes gene_type:complete